VEQQAGPDGTETAYRALLDGQVEPNTGYVVSMHEEAFN
jgi:hypothetical protein